MKTVVLVLLVAVVTARAEKIEIRQRGNEWTLRNSKMERVIALEEGKLQLKSFTDKNSGRELAGHDVAAEEFSVVLGNNTNHLSSASGGWKLVGSKTTNLNQGERQLDVTVQRDSLQVAKSYVVYPDSSIVREWVTFKNAGSAPLQIRDPSFLSLTVQPGAAQSLDFSWMSGGTTNPVHGNSKLSH